MVGRVVECGKGRAKQSRWDRARVQKIYGWLGKHPWQYRLANFLFGYDTWLRKNAIAALRLREGCRVIDLGCGICRNLGFLSKAAGKTGKGIAGGDIPEMVAASRNPAPRTEERPG